MEHYPTMQQLSGEADDMLSNFFGADGREYDGFDGEDGGMYADFGGRLNAHANLNNLLGMIEAHGMINDIENDANTIEFVVRNYVTSSKALVLFAPIRATTSTAGADYKAIKGIARSQGSTKFEAFDGTSDAFEFQSNDARQIEDVQSFFHRNPTFLQGIILESNTSTVQSSKAELSVIDIFKTDNSKKAFLATKDDRNQNLNRARISIKRAVNDQTMVILHLPRAIDKDTPSETTITLDFGGVKNSGATFAKAIGSAQKAQVKAVKKASMGIGAGVMTMQPRR
jgi:hypothetical protein